MMNKTRIEWCDFTYNPITGCRHACEYCYARRQAQRFCGDIRLNKASDQLQSIPDTGLWILDEPFKNNQGKVIPMPVGFEPAFHRYRLPMPAQKKKPANIFVGSMADLFGEWVPDEWIREVLAACAAASWHNFLFLTKNPDRYYQLGDGDEAIIPEGGCSGWFGASAATEEQAQDAWENLNCTWMSLEPLHGDFSEEFFTYDDRYTQATRRRWEWIVIGAETGSSKNKIKPKREWIQNIVDQCHSTETPLFMKDSLLEIWEDPLIQQFPEPLQMKEVIIPHCKECEHLKTTERHYDPSKEVTAMNHFCTAGRLHKRIEGRYARTSPPWCHKRGGGE